MESVLTEPYPVSNKNEAHAELRFYLMFNNGKSDDSPFIEIRTWMCQWMRGPLRQQHRSASRDASQSRRLFTNEKNSERIKTCTRQILIR
jgi:hypothetical protein